MRNTNVLLVMLIVLILLTESGIGQRLLPKDWRAESVSVDKVKCIKYRGIQSIRFELNKHDKKFNEGKRAEISTQEEPLNTEKWYLFNIYLNSDYLADSLAEIVAQWHARPDRNKGEGWRSPPVALYIKNNKWGVNIRWATNPVNTNETITGRSARNLGVCQKQKWTKWLFHIKFSYKKDGLVEIWQNGKKIYNRCGPNYYNDERGPYFKFGIYKWSWDNPDAIKNDIVTKRVLYFSGVRILSKTPAVKTDL